MTPKISVIIPVYNTEAYLHRCIDSILKQTFQNFEILLINDGSSDKSGKICDEYVKNDSRIRVFHKSNGGVSSARNLGLDNAKGERICFVDSDDWVSNNYLSSFLKKNADIVVQGFYKKKWANSLSNKWEPVSTKYIDGNTDTILSFLDLLFEIDNLGYLWSRSFENHIIKKHGLRFNSNYKLREDIDFIFRYLLHIQTYAVINDIGYYYIEPNYNNKYKRLDSDSIINCSISILDSLNKLKVNINHPIYIANIKILGSNIFNKYRRKNSNIKTITEQICKFNFYYDNLSPFIDWKCFFLKTCIPINAPRLLHNIYRNLFCLISQID